MKFTHLHVHSHYSLLDGLPKIDEILNQVKLLGMDSVALTDHGVMYGVIEFYKKAKAAGIKPIIGEEFYIAFEKMTDKRPHIDDKRFHLVLLAKNFEGYKNLIKLTTKAHLEGFYYKPRIDNKLLAQHSFGLIALSACLQGKIPRLILAKNFEEAEKLAKFYRELFGPDGFYLELQYHPNLPEQKRVNEGLIQLSRKLNIPLVATNDCHYLKSDDAEAQDILMAINTDTQKDDPERLTMKGENFSMHSPEAMAEFFRDIPEAIENTQKIAKMCNVVIPLGKINLPYFEVPAGYVPDTYLEKLCQDGLERRKIEKTKEIMDRLIYELSVIKQTGFASYFLIVQDFVNWAKENGIVVGPGRGCLLPGTKILLKNGRQKNIEEIKPGERIITHLGNKRKVEKVLSYNVKEKIAVLKSKMSAFELKLTKDHKILAARHQMCPVKEVKETICKPSCNRPCRKNLWRDYRLEWIKAQDLQKNDFLVYPISKCRQLKIKFDLLNFNNLDSHLKGDNKYVWYEIGANKLIQKRIKRFIRLDKKFARLLGFYIAEGWSRTKRRLREGTVGFGFNKNEKENIEETRKLLKEVFGLASSVIFHKTRNSAQVYAHSRITARFLERLCGKGAKNKHIPYQIFESPNEIIISFLTTLFKGDGSRKDAMRISFDSISFDLVSQIKMLLAKLGIMSSIKIRKRKRRNWHANYKLTISGKQLFRFNQLFPEFQIPIRRQRFYRNDTFIWKNYIWFPIKKASFEKYKGKVYDLTVNKDSSYVANSVTVHNSAAGSFVSYLLNITDINPLKHGLLFERFLNPERAGGLPDIDLDFNDTRRDEVIEYVAQKYGRNKVSRIITFGTMAARQVVRDVGRALGYTYSYCDQIAKMIPMFFSLSEALEKVEEFKQLYQNDAEAQRLIDLGKKLEGVARHASIHACGVVITKNPLEEYLPLQLASRDDQTIVTQYEMHTIEDMGLLKMDFLGLKNLTIIENAINLIKRTQNTEVDIDNLPLDDSKTFKLFQKGQTTGLFQYESSGMKKYLKELKPTEFNDLITMVALYRPGPIELIPDFIARKNGQKQIEYLHPKLEPILKETYGIAVFQEQILKIAREIAGFTLGEADILRKAIGKKIKSLLQEQHKKFIEGAIKNDVHKVTAERIFQFIEPFAGYAFNRSHAACYALIGYQTAYLKVHWPVEFMAALLSAEGKDIERIGFLVDECKRMGIEVLPPDINESDEYFTPLEGNKIRFGLAMIKNVGNNVVRTIIKARKEGEPFYSIADVIERVDSHDLNKKSLESLIKAGAFDKLESRARLLSSINRILDYSKEVKTTRQNGQVSLFSGTSVKFSSTLKIEGSSFTITKEEKLSWEKDLLGLYVSDHPLKGYEKALEKIVRKIKEINETFSENNRSLSGKRIRIAGVITKIQKIITRSGKPMLFLEIEDLTDRIETLIFPRILEENPTLFQINKVVFCEGTLSDKDGVPKLLCERIEEIVEK